MRVLWEGHSSMQLIGRSNESGPLVLRIKRNTAGAGAFSCRTPVPYNSQSLANCKLMLKEQFKKMISHNFNRFHQETLGV